MLKTMNKLTVANNSPRTLLGIPKYCSAIKMFAYTNVSSCQYVIRKKIYNVMKRMENMINFIIHSIVKSDMMYLSLLWKKIDKSTMRNTTNDIKPLRIFTSYHNSHFFLKTMLVWGI